MKNGDLIITVKDGWHGIEYTVVNKTFDGKTVCDTIQISFWAACVTKK